MLRRAITMTLLGLGWTGCTLLSDVGELKFEETSDLGGTDGDIDGDIDADTDADTDSDSDGDADSDVDTDSDSDMESDMPSDIGSDTGVTSNTDVDTGPETDTGQETETEIEPDTSPCGSRICSTPPSNRCTNTAGELSVYNTNGRCENDKCVYDSYAELCQSGNCVAGRCKDYPCQGVSCHSPPKPSCSDDRYLTVYNPKGSCTSASGEPKCSYASVSYPCPGGCKEDHCIDAPCSQVTCDAPPSPYCNGGVLMIYEPKGRCDNGKCFYRLQKRECPSGFCKAGRCVEDPCAGVTCKAPPAAFCGSDGSTFYTYPSEGWCDGEAGGVCTFGSMGNYCSDGCVDGQCVNEPCAYVSCDEGPNPACEPNGLLETWDWNTDVCKSGVCLWTTLTETCSDGCKEGYCAEDPCRATFCDTPPPNECVDGNLRIYEWLGTCDPMSGICDYPYFDEWCPDGCSLGACNKVSGDWEWAVIQAGGFSMGTSSSSGGPSESPEHWVTMPMFEIQRTEVTVQQYKDCVNDGVCSPPSPTSADCDNADNWSLPYREGYPLNCVSWQSAKTYCEWRGGRLPSEAEWEYAAVGGDPGREYPWGDTPKATCTEAVMDGDDGQGVGCGIGGTDMVSSRPSGNTPDGLWDMAGNVREWVMDTWHPNYATNGDSEVDAPTDGSAWITEPRDQSVVKGGSFADLFSDLRSAYREPLSSTTEDLETGFRCARGR